MIVFSDILIWPKLQPSDFVWFVFFCILVGFSYFAIQYLFGKQKKTMEGKGFVAAELIGKGFQPDEASLLKNFYLKLNEEQKAVLAETRNWKFLKKDLYDYLIESKTNPNLAVRVYEKLYSPRYPMGRPFHISDLQQGEMVALITDYGEEMVRIAKSNQQKDFLLSSTKTFLPPDVRNIPAKIYVYRVPLGGYYIKGTVIGALEDAILFHAEGEPEHVGHAHLMLEEKFEVDVQNWPRQDPSVQKQKDSGEPHHPVHQKIRELSQSEEKKLEEEIFNLEEEIRRRFSVEKVQPKMKPREEGESHEKTHEEKSKEEPKNIHFVCQGLKISDRGLVFELPESIDPHFWKNSELWELKFHMPRGRHIHTKAKIFPSTSSRTRFVAKFVDMDESLRMEIYEIIKAAGGDREVLM